MNQPNICVLGLGYIGLPTASLLATKGFKVHGVDVNERIVDNLNKGCVLIQEPTLDVMVKSAVQSGHLVAAIEPQPADIFIIAVPTPFKDDHAPDLAYVEAATRALAPHLQPGNLVILESTSPVGTTEMIVEIIGRERPDLDLSRRCVSINHCDSLPIYVAHCPERVLPGQIFRELVENDRIVGGIDPASTKKAADFYRLFVSGQVLTTDSRTAELSKLVENAHRDVNIAFANELSLICDKMDINVWELISLANRHPRVNILQPGPGVGGHCIAVDPWFVIHDQPELTPLMQTARKINEDKAHYVVRQVREKAERFKRPVVACMGLSYKPDVDDLRESPSLEITLELARTRDIEVLAVEPNIFENPACIGDAAKFTGMEEALERADILVFLVAHKEFKRLDKSRLQKRIVLDYVNVTTE